jgi:hypothetical protein
MKQADVVSVRNLLSGPVLFRTAPSHRGFVWGPPDVAQLFVDLEIGARHAAHDDDDEDDLVERFFLGAITLTPARHSVFILHDGHQRLTTLAMMLAFIRDRVRSQRQSQRIDRMLVRRSLVRRPEARLRLTPEAHAWFAHFVLPPGATRRLPTAAPIGSPRELLLAARFMEQAFIGYGDDNLMNLADFATEKTAVVRTVVDAGGLATARISSPRTPDDPLSHYGIAAE